MLVDVLRYMRCPICGRGLSTEPPAPGAGPAGGSGGSGGGSGSPVRCAAGHSFDRSRQGYLYLSAGPVAHPGDTATMVAARVDFLAAGHYQFISTALAAQAPAAGLVVDVGAGTGGHLAAVLDARPGTLGLALDASKYALRRAARAHARATAVLCDAWTRLPLADSCADLLLNVFAPRNGAEFARVLRPDGRLLVVTPEPGHLGELVAALNLLRVDPAKPQRVAASLGPWFASDRTQVLRQVLALRRAEVAALVGMGPSAWHVDPGRLAAAIAGLAEPVRVTASVRLVGYRRCPTPGDH